MRTWYMCVVLYQTGNEYAMLINNNYRKKTSCCNNITHEFSFDDMQSIDISGDHRTELTAQRAGVVHPQNIRCQQRIIEQS